MKKDTMVIKFGGSILRDGLAYRKAAKQIKNEFLKGKKIIVVVSAIKGVTDQLIQTSEAISDKMPLHLIDHIIRLGEEQSARLLTSALHLIDMNAVEITPDSPRWPIITDDRFGNAEPLIDHCKEKVKLGLLPLLERGQIPVICGFVGVSLLGEITTLGRGGSDTTAIILARCIEGSELVMVKDVGGFFSADPKKVEGVEALESLSAQDSYLLASAGAKVIQDKSIRYKPDDLDIRIIADESSFSDSGTVIHGGVKSCNFTLYPTPLHIINIIGHGTEVSKLFTYLHEFGIDVLTINRIQNNTKILTSNKPRDSIKQIHSLRSKIKFKAVSIKEDLALVNILNINEQSEKSLIKLYSGLQNIGVSIIEITENNFGVQLLVPWDQKETVMNKLKGN